MSEEKDIKEEMNQREQPDSFLIESGTAAKGLGVKLKCYYDATNIDEAQKKVENTLKIRQYLMDKGIIQ